uniref:Astacin domain-containing protein n=1 Tax=Heterorhabditis bacteriophora TaxID=37862 RepID=A0A1I7X3U6_HETBA
MEDNWRRNDRIVVTSSKRNRVHEKYSYSKYESTFTTALGKYFLMGYNGSCERHSLITIVQHRSSVITILIRDNFTTNKGSAGDPDLHIMDQ